MGRSEWMMPTSRRPSGACPLAALVVASASCSLLTPLSGYSEGDEQALREGGPAGLDASSGSDGQTIPGDKDSAGGDSAPPAMSAYESAVLMDGPVAYFRL